MYMEVIKEYLPFLILLIIIELLLAFTALVHVIKYPKYRFGNKTMWVLIVLLIQIIGPILYFLFGRGDS